jgi:molybdopterin synthase sulfur carrier subunit
MAAVRFTAHLLRHLPSADAEVHAATLREALDAVFARHPAARSYVLDEHGALRKHVVVYIDEQRLQDRRTLTDPLRPDSVVYVLQALTGG